MAKIRQSNIDTSIITGNTILNERANLSDLVLVYDQSSGTLKQISRANLVGFPTISSVLPTSVLSGDGTGNYTFTVAGQGFSGGSATFVNTSGSNVAADTVTIDSDTQITMVVAKSSLPGSGEPYDIKVTNSLNLSSVLEDQINIDQAPAYTTASGSLGSFVVGSSISVSVNATDPESAGNVSFEIQSGALPAGISLTNTAAEGGTAILSGTLPTPGSETAYNFTLRAVDAASNTSSRAFSITARPAVQQSFTSSGTFSVPAGVSSIAQVLVVAGGGGGGSSSGGGGGGAGGLILMPEYPVTASGTLTVTVGGGGVRNGCGVDSVFGAPGDPGLGQGGVLTAKGGGRGGSGGNGGSGGGVNGPNGAVAGSCATQPTQPGNSGAYGFGNVGGPGLFDSSSNPTPSGPNGNGGGGGGAGAAGQGAHPSNHGGGGGIGKSYTIADGTTSVAYAAGGGGGGGNQSLGGRIQGISGSGQGGNGNASGDATANTGSGGGGVAKSGNCTGASLGGKGIVIVAY